MKSFLSDGVLIVLTRVKLKLDSKVLETLNIKTPFIVENGAKLCDIQCGLQLNSETDKEFGVGLSELEARMAKLVI